MLRSLLVALPTYSGVPSVDRSFRLAEASPARCFSDRIFSSERDGECSQAGLLLVVEFLYRCSLEDELWDHGDKETSRTRLFVWCLLLVLCGSLRVSTRRRVLLPIHPPCCSCLAHMVFTWVPSGGGMGNGPPPAVF